MNNNKVTLSARVDKELKEQIIYESSELEGLTPSSYIEQILLDRYSVVDNVGVEIDDSMKELPNINNQSEEERVQLQEKLLMLEGEVEELKLDNLQLTEDLNEVIQDRDESALKLIELKAKNKANKAAKVPAGFTADNLYKRTVTKEEAEALANKLSDKKTYQIVADEKDKYNYALYAKNKERSDKEHENSIPTEFTKEDLYERTSTQEEAEEIAKEKNGDNYAIYLKSGGSKDIDFGETWLDRVFDFLG